MRVFVVSIGTYCDTEYSVFKIISEDPYIETFIFCFNVLCLPQPGFEPLTSMTAVLTTLSRWSINLISYISSSFLLALSLKIDYIVLIYVYKY